MRMWEILLEDKNEASTLLLSCMDHRLVDATVDYVDNIGLEGDYDHIALAGASLGVLNDKYPEWGKTFWEHVETAKKLHHIKKIIVLDHRDCGAYKEFLGEDLVENPEREMMVHAEYMRKLGKIIKKRHTDLEVELLLMALDGSVKRVEDR